MNTYLVISTANELLRIPTRHIIYITSDGNYSNILLSSGEGRLVTFQLGQLEKMIADQLHEEGAHFVRVGRQYIINLNYVYLININKQQLTLNDANLGHHTLTASSDALKALKKLIESQIA